MFCKEAWGNCYVFAERRYCQFLCSSEKRCMRYAIRSLFPECKQLSTKPSTDTNDLFLMRCEHFRSIAMDIFSNPCASLTVSENRKRMIENREAPMTSTNGHYFTLLSLLQGGLRKFWVWQRQVARECPHHPETTQLNCLTIQKRWCYHGLPIKTNQRKYAKCVA